MADDDNSKVEEVVNDDATQEPVEETQEQSEEQSTEEESTEVTEEETQEESTEAETTEDEGAQRPPSRRETLRIQDLLNKYGHPKPAPQPTRAKREDALDYETAFNIESPEVVQQLEADRKAESDAQFNAGLKQAERLAETSQWRTLLEIDAPRMEEKYGWLNPKDRENFNPAVANAINEEYQRFAGYDPESGLISNNVRYSDFVEARVELSTRLAEAMTQKTAKNIAKQTATTAIRPDGSSAPRVNPTGDPKKMTTEELYAVIGQKPPK